MQQKNNLSQRNKLLTSSKRDLIKICKQSNINIKGCLAKMDFVGKILQHQKKQQNKTKKKKKGKKTKANTKNKKNKKNNSKKRSLSENMSDRDRMLKLKKTDLLKFSKANALNTEFCFAKIDFVNTLMDAGYAYSDLITATTTTTTTTTTQQQQSQSQPPNEAKRRVPINWDKGSDTESDSEYSTDEFELECPEYIPARTSLNKVFDINILTNLYKEENYNNKPRIQWGYTPTPSDDIQGKRKSESLSVLSSLESPAESMGITKFKPANSMQIILDDEDENEQDFKQQKWENDPFQRMDFALGQYYKYFDRTDYFNDEGEGKFLLFCKYNKLLDEKILNEQYESADDPQKCPFLVFDETFPLILTVSIESNQNDKDKREKELRLVEIYNVMEYCYHHGQSPYF